MRFFKLALLPIIFLPLFFAVRAYAQSISAMEEYIYNNSGVKEVSFKSNYRKVIKLVTFSDATMKIDFLVGGLSYKKNEYFKDGLAISVKIDDSDTVVSFGNFTSTSLESSYSYPFDKLKNDLNLQPNDCVESNDGRLERCVRMAIIDSITKSNKKNNKYGSSSFFNKMSKMKFEVKKIAVEVNNFDVKNVVDKAGCHPIEFSVYVYNGKLIGVLESRLCMD